VRDGSKSCSLSALAARTALLDDVLDATMVTDAVEEAIQLLMGQDDEERAARLDAERVHVERERVHLVAAIASGGLLRGLLEALRAREARRASLEAERDARAQRTQAADERNRARERGAFDLAGAWRQGIFFSRKR
jgi:hypothetical protein